MLRAYARRAAVRVGRLTDPMPGVSKTDTPGKIGRTTQNGHFVFLGRVHPSQIFVYGLKPYPDICIQFWYHFITRQ